MMASSYPMPFSSLPSLSSHLSTPLSPPSSSSSSPHPSPPVPPPLPPSSPQIWEEVGPVSGTKRRHRSEVDSRRRQREAELLRRLLSLSSPPDGAVLSEGGDLDDLAVVEVIEEDGRRRRRRIQKLDILERASATIERLKNIRESDCTRPHQSQRRPPIRTFDEDTGESNEAVTANVIDSMASLSPGLTRSLHSALLSLSPRWSEKGQLQPSQNDLPTPRITANITSYPCPTTTPINSFPTSYPSVLSNDKPPTLFPNSCAVEGRPMSGVFSGAQSPAPLDLPLDCHVHRCVAEWYEEAYHRSYDPSLLRQVAFHWLHAAKAESSHLSLTQSSSPSSPWPCFTPPISPPPPFPRSFCPTVDVSPVDVSPAVSTGSNLRVSSAPAVPSPSALLYCRHRAIHWLREAATAVMGGQGVHWEVVKWLKRAAELIDELPDHRSFEWRRELLLVHSLYCATYSCFVGITQSVVEWSRLCSLCDEVQSQLSCVMEEGKGKDEVVSALTLTTFYALRGFHLALNASTRVPIDLAESIRTSARMQAIAECHPSHLIQAHALYVEAIEKVHHGQYEDTIRLAHEAWDLCAEHYAPRCIFTVNPLAPEDPGLGALCCAANALCLLGRLSEAVEYADRCVSQAALNQEPVTCQEVLGMRCYISSQLEEFKSHADHFLAYLHYSRASEQGPISSLYETVLALYQITEEPQYRIAPEAAVEVARECWRRYEKGDSFIIAFSSPLCEVLSKAGMWREGLRLVEDWQFLSQHGDMSFNWSNCPRYRAKFLLQQADTLEQEQRQSTTQGGERGEHCEGEGEALPGHHTQTEAELSFADLSFPSLANCPTSPSVTLELSDHGLWDGGSFSVLSPPLELTTADWDFSGPSPPPGPAPPSSPPVVTTAPHLLREEAVLCLREAIATAEKLQTRLLEMKAIMDLLTAVDDLRLMAGHTSETSPTTSTLHHSWVSEEALTVYRNRLRRLLEECEQGNQRFTVIQRAQSFCIHPAAGAGKEAVNPPSGGLLVTTDLGCDGDSE